MLSVMTFNVYSLTKPLFFLRHINTKNSVCFLCCTTKCACACVTHRPYIRHLTENLFKNTHWLQEEGPRSAEMPTHFRFILPHICLSPWLNFPSPHFISTQPRLYNRTQCPQMQINKSYPSILVIPLFVWINSTHQLKVTFWASSARRPVYNAEWNPSYGVSPTGTWGSKCLVVSQ